MSLTVLNDWHLGAVRTGGTTPATAYQLRLDLLQQFEDTLAGINTDLMILGDLFDGPDISKADLLRAYQALDGWLVTGKQLYLVNGNHDLAKNSTNFSSFQFLAELLCSQHSGWVHHITEGTMTPHGYVIPHVVNQDLFNLELAKAPECDVLYLHANYDNQFAVESDHSLNVSREQAEAAPVKFIVFAHEHQARTELSGKVVVIGNQVPSSISDCLNNKTKQHLVVERNEHGVHLCGKAHWRAEDDYLEIDWRSLSQGIADCIPQRFIRVTGTAAAGEAAAVVTAISRFRSTSTAIVVGNAVKIEGMEDAEQLELSHEEITAFNVRDALRELLTDDENNKIDTLLSKKESNA